MDPILPVANSGTSSKSNQLGWWARWRPQPSPDGNVVEPGYPERIEDFRNGYPRLAAFTAADPSFGIVRGFVSLFARKVLLKQDRLAELEAQLNLVDAQESTQWYLSSRRADKNLERIRVIQDIDVALEEYVAAIQSYQYISSLEKPGRTYKQSVKNWMERYKPLVREEARYLDYNKDLVSLSIRDDRGKFDEMIEWLLDRSIPPWITTWVFASKSNHTFTGDKNIHLYNPDKVQRLSRLVTTLLAVFLLLVPIVVLYNLPTDRQKFLTIIFSTVIFATLLTLTTKARKVEIFAATAAYGAVLVVYVAGNP